MEKYPYKNYFIVPYGNIFKIFNYNMYETCYDAKSIKIARKIIDKLVIEK